MQHNIEIIESDKNSHDNAIDVMKEFFEDDKPQLGIFWLDPKNMVLFGVQKGDAEYYISKDPNKTTYPKLHKTYWQKQHHKAVAQNNTSSIFYNEHDYTKIPRGRIFYENNEFVVYIGDWYKDINLDKFIELIEDEFNLTDFKFKIDEHWNLGHGWSEEKF